MHDSDNFQKLKWLPINQMFKINKLDLLKKVIDGRAPEYLQAWTQFGLSTSILQEQKTLYRLPILRTEARRRTFFYSSIKEFNALKT